MPGQYDIGPRLVPSARFGLMLNGRRVGVEMLDTGLLLLVVITIGVWVMGAVLGGRNGRGRWSWLGGLLLIGSIMVLFAGLFIFVFGPALLPQSWLADSTAEVSTIARGLMQAFVQQLGLRALIAGGVCFFVAWLTIWLGML